MQSNALFYELTTIYRPFLNRLDKELHEFNLFSSQWRILKFLLDYGPHTISEIAHHSYVEKPTITRLVQKLIERGYVEAVTGSDKRVRMIQLTKTGTSVSRSITLKLGDFYDSLLEGVPLETQEIMLDALIQISSNLKNS